ncbi:galactose oxidase-like domain-containing protein [Arthrobacter sp. fls2-241-R2A-172]|uniref:galactose oxidase-like domain-containing protein n=1 Tax=Arthrobacter sp. fls2-241-R2A-172 TaxID=3040325 RepID=UPI00254F41EB|nr:galactose oxidase-like domain-containing protein [Arthrobacter sp. fls2-241-R2A-172]
MLRIFSSRALVLLASLSLAVAGSVLGLLPAAGSAAAAVPLATDRIVSTHQSTPSTRIVSPAFTTSQPNELLVAFLMSDGPKTTGGESFVSVAGGGLSWRLRKRTNTQWGTAEIWQAVAPNLLTNATVTATNAGAFQSSMTVVTFAGADVATDGAVGTGNATTGAPSASLTTTRAGSWVWGVGNDWDKAVARTVGAGQTKVDEYLSNQGDSFWVQRQTAVTAQAPPTVVAINDTAPTTDRWNLSVIEILPAAPATGDTTPPVISGVSAGTPSTSGATITWTTDEASSTQVEYGTTAAYGQNTVQDPTLQTTHSAALSGLSAGTLYHYRVKSADAAGNLAVSGDAAFTTAGSGTDPSVVGSWGPVVAWPEVSIHAALTPTGKVLTWQGDFSQGGQQYLLDPVTGNYTQVPSAAVDLFCAGQAVLPDGRILVVGGTATSGGLGIRDVTAFDPTTETWQSLAPMNHPRWYPTATTLADGRVLVTSGANTNSTDIVTIPEVYSPTTNSWTDLPGANRNIPYYPFIYQLPDGRILQAGASEQATSSLALNISTQQWATVDARVLDAASIANYAPGKFIKAGSAADGGFTGQSSNTAYTLDMNAQSPAWQATASMAFPRSFVNLTNLPDGTVLATGGGTDKSGQDISKAVMPAEIWQPTAGTWSTVAPMSVPRLYHSVAVLLPDGRVFVSGSGGDTGVADQKSYQIYSPPYLFKGPRPSISSVPGSAQYSSTAFIGTPDGARIQSVSLIKTGSVTHAFDQNAVAMNLGFSQAAGGLNVQMPANGNYAPPGYYLLSIVDGNGVPSTAGMIRLSAPSQDTTPPTAPTNLSASASAGQIALTWTAGTDNVGVTSYRVSRDGTLVGSSASTSYSDTSVLAGTTYTYTVAAVDAAGNVSPPSNTATAQAVAAGSGITVDKIVSVHQGTSTSTISAPGVTTTGSNELLLAFVSSDGPNSANSASISSVSGGGLSWTLRQRSNTQPGTAEIWQAVAPGPLSNATVTATQASGSWQAAMSVVAFRGADIATGATLGANAASGAPTATLTTTRAGSWVWGVGTDWSNPIARTAGPNQTLVDQYLAPAGDTYWVQRQNSATPTNGTAVTINDTSPTTDRWNLAVIEIRAAP